LHFGAGNANFISPKFLVGKYLDDLRKMAVVEIENSARLEN
jgi:hypothetical protein